MFDWLAKLIFGTSVKTGVLEKIELTFGSAGHQIMTIDGCQYATWIDVSKWPKVGETVTFEVSTQPDGRGNMLRCAKMIAE